MATRAEIRAAKEARERTLAELARARAELDAITPASHKFLDSSQELAAMKAALESAAKHLDPSHAHADVQRWLKGARRQNAFGEPVGNTMLNLSWALGVMEERLEHYLTKVSAEKPKLTPGRRSSLRQTFREFLFECLQQKDTIRVRELLEKAAKVRTAERFSFADAYMGKPRKGETFPHKEMVEEIVGVVQYLHDKWAAKPSDKNVQQLLAACAQVALREHADNNHIKELSCATLCAMAKEEVTREGGSLLAALGLAVPVIELEPQTALKGDEPLILREGKSTLIVSRFGVAQIQDGQGVLLSRNPMSGEEEIGPLHGPMNGGVREALREQLLEVARMQRSVAHPEPKKDADKIRGFLDAIGRVLKETSPAPNLPKAREYLAQVCGKHGAPFPV